MGKASRELTNVQYSLECPLSDSSHARYREEVAMTAAALAAVSFESGSPGGPPPVVPGPPRPAAAATIRPIGGGPRRIGEIMPEVLVRYGLDPATAAAGRLRLPGVAAARYNQGCRLPAVGSGFMRSLVERSLEKVR